MYYRMPDYRADKEVNETVDAQSFTNQRTEFKLNKRTNELEVLPDKTDLAQLIQSSIDTALDRVLQRLQPDVDDMPDTLEQDYDNSIDDLNDLAQAVEVAETYRERLNLPLEMSVTDIYKQVSDYSETLRQKISEKNTIKETDTHEKTSQENDPKGE